MDWNLEVITLTFYVNYGIIILMYGNVRTELLLYFKMGLHLRSSPKGRKGLHHEGIQEEELQHEG